MRSSFRRMGGQYLLRGETNALISDLDLYYRRELWTSKSAGFNSTKSLKICRCKKVTSNIVRAANSKLLGTKILELPKPFRVQTWKYLKNFSEVRTYLNSKFEFQVFPSLLENTLTHFLLLFDIIKRNVWSSSKFFSMYS